MSITGFVAQESHANGYVPGNTSKTHAVFLSRRASGWCTSFPDGHGASKGTAAVHGNDDDVFGVMAIVRVAGIHIRIVLHNRHLVWSDSVHLDSAPYGINGDGAILGSDVPGVFDWA